MTAPPAVPGNMGEDARPEALDALLRPRSVAVVGASADPSRVSGRVLSLLRRGGFDGAIHLVNPRRAEIDGLRCCPSIADLPDGVDLAVLTLPATATVEAVRQLGARGIRAAVAFASGFSEVGAEGAALERDLVAAARAGGVRVLGPNSLGLVNALDRVVASFGQYPDREITPGPIALATQSGAFGTAIAALARDRGVPVGYFVATGNEADLDVAEVAEAMLRDPRVSVCAVYVEGLRDGAKFVGLAAAAAQARKPLVVVKAGRSAAGARAAQSHTGVLAGEDAVFDGLCRQHAILRARNEEHLLDIAETVALLSDRAVTGRGLGIVSTSGGAGALLADHAEALGLDVATLAPETRAALKALLPAFASTGNPIDVTGQFLEHPHLITDALVRMLADPGVDLGVVWLQLLEAHAAMLVDAFRAARETSDKPFAVAWVAAPAAAVAALLAAGIPVLRGGDAALDGLAALVRTRAPRRDRPVEAEHASVALPDCAGPVAAPLAARLLARAGVSCAPAIEAWTAEEAVAAAERCGYPVALKVESPDIPHKTEAGGVRLNLCDAAAVTSAFHEVLASAARVHPGARAVATVVQPMVGGAVEMAVGLRHDPVFGMLVMVGLGGTLVEVTRDVTFRLAPVDAAEAERMLDELAVAPRLLAGVRGKPPADRAALAELIAAASRFGAAAGPRLAELDLNPVMAGPEGATAVDWLMILNM